MPHASKRCQALIKPTIKVVAVSNGPTTAVANRNLLFDFSADLLTALILPPTFYGLWGTLPHSAADLVTDRSPGLGLEVGGSPSGCAEGKSCLKVRTSRPNLLGIKADLEKSSPRDQTARLLSPYLVPGRYLLERPSGNWTAGKELRFAHGERAPSRFPFGRHQAGLKGSGSVTLGCRQKVNNNKLPC